MSLNSRSLWQVQKTELLFFIYLSGADSDIVLDASKSFDPDREKTAVESVTWECYDKNLNPCFIPSANKTNMVRLTFPATKKVVVRNGTLKSNAS